MTTKSKPRKGAAKAAPVTLATVIAQHKAAIAAIEAVYNSFGGESDEFTESVNYEDDVCNMLALIPCATDAEFLEKLRWLFARDVAHYGKPSFRNEFGGTLVALIATFQHCQPRRRLRHCRPGAVVRGKPLGAARQPRGRAEERYASAQPPAPNT
jgi:hypothetical protein